LAFDNIYKTASCPDNGSLDLTGPLSISCWVRVGERADNRAYVCKRGVYFLGYGFTEEGGPSDRFCFFADFGTGGENYIGASGGEAAVIGQWYHLLGTYDGSAVRLYVNGVLAGSAPHTGAIRQFDYAIYLGNVAGRRAAQVSDLDEIVIWDRALSPSEAAGLYNGGAGVETAPSADTKLILHLNENGGQTAFDASGNGNDFQLGASPLDPLWFCEALPTPLPSPSPHVTATPIPTPTAVPCDHSGDVNGDGQVTPGDAQRTFDIYLSCALQNPTRDEYCAADFCGSGEIEPCDNSVTPSDAQGIMRFYLGYAEPCAKRGGGISAASRLDETRMRNFPTAANGDG